MMDGADSIKRILERIYGKQRGLVAFTKLMARIKRTPLRGASGNERFDQTDAVFITYGDTLQKKGTPPLAVLTEFAAEYLDGVFSTIHVLPFFPYSSDDGFSVMDFFSVDPHIGNWEDVRQIGSRFKLMFDYVLNHVSAKSSWFEKYRSGKKGYAQLAMEIDLETDLTMVTRPRSLPLLTEVNKKDGTIAHVWTTFSADQIDLNYNNIDTLEKMVDVFLFYVEQGADILRLDAIAYLWKQIGTSCVHLDQTHDMVKLFRSILDIVAPDVMIVTETNVPHPENISYFGNGQNEAQMVYNFTLPPLLLYSFIAEDTTLLSQWARQLYVASRHNTFFNFTASHDGIGVRPLEGILSTEEIERLIRTVKKRGGHVSYKQNPDGSQSPYELNITYVDALRDMVSGSDRYHVDRFLASQAIQYVLPGVPATYIHSLLGSRNWDEGVRITNRARTINREKLQMAKIAKQVENPETFRSKIFHAYCRMIRIRKQQPAFHPNAAFEILTIHPRAFAIRRQCPEQTLFSVTNVSERPVALSLSGHQLFGAVKDLISGIFFKADDFSLAPYQFVWFSQADSNGP
jgi:sucrose phosphorylase